MVVGSWLFLRSGKILTAEGAENGRRVLGEKLLTAKVAKNIREGRTEMPERFGRTHHLERNHIS
jgi:hypothetical protein